MELEEAVTRADGQLLELIALLTTGKRLRAVLSSQVHALRAPDRAGQLRLARLICAADLLGVSLPAESVGPGADVEASELPASLDRLRGEHIVVADRDAWSGLHQRRSGEISSLIHDVPPPSLETTFAAVADSVDISALGWVVGRATEELGRDSEELAESVRGRSRTIGTATELAELVEFLERADHALTAIQYVPILERHRKPEISIRQLAFPVLGNKLGGVEFKDTGTPLLDRTFRALRSCAEELPDRSALYCAAVWSSVSQERIVDLLSHAELGSAVRLVEAAERYLTLEVSALQAVASRFPWPDGQLDLVARSLQSRLIASLAMMTDQPLPAKVFGTTNERLDAIAASHPNVVSALLDSSEGTSATLELLMGISDEQARTRQPWDPVAPTEDDSSINVQAVGLAETVLAACPEVAVVEVITVTPDGRRLVQNGFEPGHKRLERASLPRAASVRVNVGVMAAISRQTAANSWSQVARQRSAIAGQVADLLAEAPRRLAKQDNAKRRNRWVESLKSAEQQCAALRSIPVVAGFDPSENAVQADSSARSDDPLSKVLSEVVGHLLMIVPEGDGKLIPLATAEQLTKAARKLRQALDNRSELVVTGETDLYDEIHRRLRRLATLLACLDAQPTAAGRIKGPPAAFDQAVDALVSELADQQLTAQRGVLDRHFASIPTTEIAWVRNADAYSPALASQQWVVVVEPEHWETCVTALADWPDDAWPIAGPDVTVLVTYGDYLLPFGARLATSMPAKYVPIGSADVEVIAGMLSKGVISGSATAATAIILRNILDMSWRIARDRMRPDAWSSAEYDVATASSAIRLRINEIEDGGPTANDLQLHLSGMLDRVIREGSNGVPGELAGSIAGADLAGSPDALDSPAFADFGTATLLALEVDVEAASIQ